VNGPFDQKPKKKKKFLRRSWRGHELVFTARAAGAAGDSVRMDDERPRGEGKRTRQERAEKHYKKTNEECVKRHETAEI